MNTLTEIDVLSVILSLVATLILGYRILPHLHRFKFLQIVRADGPKTHYLKNGTPTFGGFIFLPIIYIALILQIFFEEGHVRLDILFFFIVMLFMSLIGFVDDFVKVKINKGGLTVAQKSTYILGVCLLITIYTLIGPMSTTMRGGAVIYLFFPPYEIVVHGWWNVLYAVFIMLYLYFCINSVNLTDGVDGLASSVTCIVVLALAAVTYVSHVYPHWMTVTSLVILGSLLGFLHFNSHPARVFMGDTGSLALGTAVTVMPLLMGMPWIFALIGIIYVVEGLSVVIQVSYFKATKGKRIFRMSPIHHHFELGGWPEVKVVAVFTAITIIFSFIALIIYKFVIVAGGKLV